MPILRTGIVAVIPLLTKEGWRNRASPIGRSIKRRRAGVVAYTETFRRERPPHLRLRRRIPSFVRRGFFAPFRYLPNKTTVLLGFTI